MRMRVGDARLLQVVVNRGAPFLVPSLHLDHHLRAPRLRPRDLLVFENPRLVLPGVNLDFEIVSQRPRTGPGDNLDWLASGELPVHASRGDADALLAPAHPQAVELGPIEQLGENSRNLLPDDTRPVVGNRDAKACGLARRQDGSAIRHDVEPHHDIR